MSEHRVAWTGPTNRMADELRILIVDDSAQDAVLIDRELRQGGLTFVSKRVDTQAQFLYQLRHHPPDLVLTDHGLPSFDGFKVLAILRERSPEVPCVFVSGAMNDELAVEAIQSNATGCVSKSRLSERLIPVARQALQVAEERRRHKEAEAHRARRLRDLEAALVEFRVLSANLPICPRCKRAVRDAQGVWHELQERLRAHVGNVANAELCPECAQGAKPFPGRTGRGRATGAGRLARIADWHGLAERAHYRAAELALLCQVSLRHLERHFRARFRRGVSNWLGDVRLQRAWQLLQAGRRVSDVAYTLGYKQLSHFSRVFRQRYGFAPSTVQASGTPCPSSERSAASDPKTSVQ